MKKISLWATRLRHNGLFQTSLGFVSFLVVAAAVMLLLESTINDSGIDSFFHSLWFSVVTVTTVGYGDLSPVSGVGKIAAVVIMFIGIAYSGVLTGNITTWLVERNRKKELGQVPLKGLDSKFLICGWKPDMHSLLYDILRTHNKTSDYLILVNKADPKAVNELKQDPHLKDLQFFSGDYTNPEILENACAKNAEKVLIVADDSSNRGTEEIDFQSVLSAMAINRINKDVYTVVEILMPKFQLYLQQIKVEEVVLNRLRSKALMCNAALMSGVYNICHSLFNLENGLLKIREIKSHLVGKSYREVQGSIDDVVIIGVMENTGNLKIRKKEKLDLIQKSPSIKDAISGLFSLKEMKNNQPIIHPPPNYVIQENSSLIILETRPEVLHQPFDYSMAQLKQDKIISTLENVIFHKFQDLIDKANNWDDFIHLFLKGNFHFSVAEGEVKGFIYQEKSYSFEALGFKDNIIHEVNLLYQINTLKIEQEVAALKKNQMKFKTFKSKWIKQFDTGQESQLTGDGILMICGWKSELLKMLKFLVEQAENNTLEWNKIIVVADINIEDTQRFIIEFEQKDNIELVRGDYLDSQVLREAGIHKATKVMVLAETDSKKTIEEIDAQTVLASMVINDLNKHAYKVVEIMDQRYESTLVQANVEEIILVDKFNRIMLVNGSSGMGISNVIREMINFDTPLFEVLEIEERFIGDNFGKMSFDLNCPGLMILGLLEESGNVYARKLERIKQAQVQPKIKDSVMNLNKVKAVGANHVIFAPEAEYKIRPHTKMIVLNTNDYSRWKDYLSDIS
ncbi:MAG: NAD-binding protein [Deltaproteobacteria bacterium]|nr:NAD-binding protein [Deltaproteobacteria bacterium]